MSGPPPPPPAADAAPWVLGGPIAADQVPGLCRRLGVLLCSTGAPVVICDVGGLPADAGALEALARLGLTARRRGRRIRLRNPSLELERLVGLAGLAGVLPVESPRLHRGGQSEEREQAGGVEEGVDRGHPAA